MKGVYRLLMREWKYEHALELCNHMLKNNKDLETWRIYRDLAQAYLSQDY